MDLSRRSLLGLGALSLVDAAYALPRREGVWNRKKPKNIIFMVADGMAASVPTMSDYFQQLTKGHRSYWAELMGQEYAVNALQETRSLSSIVTDSSAASSTWGSGRRIWNGMVNMYPDKTELRTLTDLMSSAGVRCGLVTTTTATHATPAGFAVTCISRDREQTIAENYLKSGISVLMGGGNRFFDPAKRGDKKDLYADFEKAGFKVVKDRGAMLSHGSGKLLGIFSDSHLPFTVDRDNNPDLVKKVPTIAEMTAKAIDLLKGGSNGFLLQVEGGKVDHGAHANDVAAMFYDMMAFEEAVKVAIDFALADGETLVIITSDHATGGPALNGDGTEYFDSTAGLTSLGNMKASVGEVISAFGKEADQALVSDVVKTKLGISLTDEEASIVAGINKGETPFSPAKFLKSKSSAIGAILGNHCRVTWTSGNHTCDHVLVTAVGPGSDKVHGVVRNTSFFDIMLDMKELKWSNPTMSFEDAAKHMKNLKDGGGMPEAAEAITPDELSHYGLL